MGGFWTLRWVFQILPLLFQPWDWEGPPEEQPGLSEGEVPPNNPQAV